MDIRTQILHSATNRFLKEGFKRVSLDIIAKDLSMSKKTLYEYYSSKDELIDAVSDFMIISMRSKIEGIMNSNMHSMKKAFLMINTSGQLFLKVSPQWFNDLQSLRPELWKKIDDFRTAMMTKNITQMLSEGIEQGNIINFPLPLLAQIFISSIRGVINPEFVMKVDLSIDTIFQNTITFLFNAILTEKGQKEFNKIKKSEIQTIQLFDF